MQIAGSYGARSRRTAKPPRRRLGRTWQDRAWRVRLLGQMSTRASAAPPSGHWRSDADRADREHHMSGHV